jgi:hypothetical protein
MCWVCGTNWGGKKNASRMLMGKPKGQWQLSVGGRTILTWNFKKWNEALWTKFTWFRAGTSGGLLWESPGSIDVGNLTS